MRLITVDTSALVAILANEQSREALQMILSESKPIVSSVSLLECYMRMKSIFGEETSELIDELLNEFAFTVTEFGLRHVTFAQIAFEKFGKGRHPASLNFGDCIVYATAKLIRTPILCLGNDFAKTDADLVKIPV